jgi:putative membrane protein
MINESDDRILDSKPNSAAVPEAAGRGGAIREILGGFAASLGFARSPRLEPAESALDTRTLLAMDRTYWAAERTLMGWIRTALSMIGFGFTIGKIGQTLENFEVKGFRGVREIGVDTVAYMLVVLGTVSLLAAAVQYSRSVYALQLNGLRVRPSIAFLVALVLCAMGIVAFGSLVSNL